MADNLGARKDSKPVVMFKILSAEWFIYDVLPLLYPINRDLSNSNKVSKNVNYNGDPAFKSDSDTKNVRADEAAFEIGGLVSQTRLKKATPYTYSSSVRVNKKNAVRGLDSFWMNNNNTIGTLVFVPPPKKGAITDTGKVAEAEPAPEMPSFMDFF